MFPKEIRLFGYNGYRWMNYWSSNNFPCICVVSIRFDGDEKSIFDQNFGCVEDCAFLFSDAAGAVDADVAHTDL